MMNCAQVRIQMEGYRTGGEDALSPGFREMREHLEACPTCRDRFDRIQAVDQGIGRVMRGVHAPEGMKDTILGGLIPTKTQTSHKLFPGFGFALSAAAVLVAALLLGRGIVAPSPEMELLSFFIQDTRSHSELDARITDPAAARTWFEEQGLDVTLPSQLRGDVPLVGCRTLVFDGKPVAFLCLEKGSRLLSLYVFPKGSLDPQAFGGEGSWNLSKGGWTARGWSEGAMTYIAALPGERNDLDQFLTVS